MFRKALAQIRDEKLYKLAPEKGPPAVKGAAVTATKLKHTAFKSPPAVKGAAKHATKPKTTAVKIHRALKGPDEKKDQTEELFAMLFGEESSQGDQGDQGHEVGAGDEGDQGSEDSYDKWMAICDL